MEPNVLFKEVNSSNISKVGHQSDKLFVVFKRNNSCYEYSPVSRQLYLKVIGAQSVGSYFSKHIQKNKLIKHKGSKAHE